MTFLFPKKEADTDKEGKAHAAEYFRFGRNMGFTKVKDLEVLARIGHMRE